MKTNKSILKTFMAAAMMFVFASTANAQFPKVGNIGNVIKNKAEGTIESVASKAKNKAEEKARKKMEKGGLKSGKDAPGEDITPPMPPRR